MQTNLDFFKEEVVEEQISLKICDQLNDMSEEEYEAFMKAWVD